MDREKGKKEGITFVPGPCMAWALQEVPSGWEWLASGAVLRSWSRPWKW